MSYKLPVRWLVLVATTVAVLVSCGTQVGNLPDRVVGFLHSYDPENPQTYVDYFTPKIQESLSKFGSSTPGGLAMPGLPIGLQKAGKENLSKVTTGDLSFQVRKSKGRQWAEVTVSYDSAAGRATEKLIWIRVDGQWYLFGKTAGEETEYGQPPYFVT